MTAPDSPDRASCGHPLGPKPVAGEDGTVYCSIFCRALDRPAVALRFLLSRADAMEAEQAERRRLDGRTWGSLVLNGKKT